MKHPQPPVPTLLADVLDSEDEKQTLTGLRAREATLVARMDEIRTELRDVHDRQAAVRDATIARVLDTVTVEDFWADATLRTWLAVTEYDTGRGHSDLQQFIADAFASRVPTHGGLYDFNRVFRDDDEYGLEWVGLAPYVAPRRGQDVTELADALAAMVDPLGTDGHLTGIEVLGELEFSPDHWASVVLDIHADGTAQVRGRGYRGPTVKTGTVLEALTWIAARVTT